MFSVIPRTREAARTLGCRCDECPLKDIETAPVHSYSPQFPGPVAYVGEGPGADEELTGEPFVGRSGELLRREARAVSHPLETSFVGNVTRCRFPFDLSEADRNRAARACVPGLLKELEALQPYPRVVVLLGKVAARAFDLAKWWKRQGYVHRMEIGDGGVINLGP